MRRVNLLWVAQVLRHEEQISRRGWAWTILAQTLFIGSSSKATAEGGMLLSPPTLPATCHDVVGRDCTAEPLLLLAASWMQVLLLPCLLLPLAVRGAWCSQKFARPWQVCPPWASLSELGKFARPSQVCPSLAS